MQWLFAVIILLALGFVALRALPTSGSAPTDDALAPTPVAVVKVSREDLYNEITIGAEFRPYAQVDLHAKVSGYLTNISVDFGDKVKAGQLLAELEMPELADELNRARAAMRRAEADYKVAHLSFSRLMAVEKAHPNLVAQQELDSAEAKDSTAEAAIASAKADVARYETLMDYTRITAPFDGLITGRYADAGALIQAGTASSSKPLLKLSENDRLRLDIPVSVSYVSYVQVGDPVDIIVDGFKTNLVGTIARSTWNVEPATRTMRVEVDVPNPDLKLIPGMYASVVLRLEHRDKALVVPVEAVSRKQTTTVLVVDAAGKIEERTIQLGLETPHKVEVLSGLNENDEVMIGSRSQIKPGQKVEAKLIAANKAE